jgi:hypothetical protein
VEWLNMVECLPSKHEALSSNPSTEKEKEKQRKKLRESRNFLKTSLKS